ncbi:MAG TPA: hypothetical protein DEO98_03985 [Legionellales bacterium]|nr:hypothetical protein [Legionellales bacterium]|tara:strand:- start:3647 stop:5485 length:1839 start_codon:yes stop_codon:yes gene_type:complete
MTQHSQDLKILIICDDGILTQQHVSESLAIYAKHLAKQTSSSDNQSQLPCFQIVETPSLEEGLSLLQQASNSENSFGLVFIDIQVLDNIDAWIHQVMQLDSSLYMVLLAQSRLAYHKLIQRKIEANLLVLAKPVDAITLHQIIFLFTEKWQLLRDKHYYQNNMVCFAAKRIEELQHKVMHDDLTGSPNRILLNDRMAQAILNYQRHDGYFAVLFLDLDKFKAINDTLGHHVGDELLKIIAKRLSQGIRALDTLARLGGDEFVVVMTDLKQLYDVQKTAVKILEAIHQEIIIENHVLRITSSIGIAIYPQDGQNSHVLLRHADEAMYQSKRLGGNQFQFYSKKIQEKLKEAWYLELDLHQAVDKQQFILWYQPQFCLKDQKIKSVEALIRWVHPIKGLLLPIKFMPIALRNGLILPIGQWIIKEAARQNKRWQEAGFDPIQVVIKLDEAQLEQADFIQQIQVILNKTGLPPQYLEFELNENMLVKTRVIQKITELSKLGVSIALNGIGTGCAKWHHLSQLPLNRLKLAKSLIQTLKFNQQDKIILQAVVNMAMHLNMDLLAQGIENSRQLDFLQKQGCTQVQGFYFSKPLAVKAIARLLDSPMMVKKILTAVK